MDLSPPNIRSVRTFDDLPTEGLVEGEIFYVQEGVPHRDTWWMVTNDSPVQVASSYLEPEPAHLHRQGSFCAECGASVSVAVAQCPYCSVHFR